jgi:hypothetical protein
MSEELMTQVYIGRLRKLEREVTELRFNLATCMEAAEKYMKAVEHMNDGCDCCAMYYATDVPEYAQLQGLLCDLHHDLRGPE